MRKFTIAAIVSVAMAGFGAAGATAAPNPSGTGQPGAECEPGATRPAGFGTTGFGIAEAHYAGSEGTPSAANGSSHAVSQYDVACFQVTSNQPGS